MNEIPVNSFRMASEQFQEQVRGGFGQSLVADVLDPMLRELESLSSVTDETAQAMESLAGTLKENNP